MNTYWHVWLHIVANQVVSRREKPWVIIGPDSKNRVPKNGLDRQDHKPPRVLSPTTTFRSNPPPAHHDHCFSHHPHISFPIDIVVANSHHGKLAPMPRTLRCRIWHRSATSKFRESERAAQ